MSSQSIRANRGASGRIDQFVETRDKAPIFALDQPDPLVGFGKIAQYRAAAVARPVIQYQKLEIGKILLQYRLHTSAKIRRTVIDAHDDRKGGRSCHAPQIAANRHKRVSSEGFAMRLALYQPDIAGNVGTILRMTACFGVPCDIIEPCGFAFSERALKRAGMDYAAQATMVRHADWDAFVAFVGNSRLVLMTTKASTALPDFAFHADDVILMGSESAGVPDAVHDRADARVHIPMRPEFRSLNVAVAAGIALGRRFKADRQFPGEEVDPDPRHPPAGRPRLVRSVARPDLRRIRSDRARGRVGRELRLYPLGPQRP